MKRFSNPVWRRARSTCDARAPTFSQTPVANPPPRPLRSRHSPRRRGAQPPAPFRRWAQDRFVNFHRVLCRVGDARRQQLHRSTPSRQEQPKGTDKAKSSRGSAETADDVQRAERGGARRAAEDV